MVVGATRGLGGPFDSRLRASHFAVASRGLWPLAQGDSWGKGGGRSIRVTGGGGAAARSGGELGSAREEQLSEVGPRDAVVTGNLVQHPRQRAYAQCAVAWHRHMVFTVRRRGEADVTAGLPRGLVAQAPEQLREVVPRNVPRESHTAMTRSLT